MGTDRALVFGVDLARTTDFPAVAAVEAYREEGDIRHGDTGSLTHFCERWTCYPSWSPRYDVRALMRLPRPGIERGVRPVLEYVSGMLHDARRRDPKLPLAVWLDISGGDFLPLAREVFANAPKHTLTGVTMTASGEAPSRGVTQPRVSISRTTLISNLEVRLEQRQVKLPRRAYREVRGELASLRRTISPARNLVYETPPGKHDDLIVALSLAVWAEPLRGVISGPSSLVWD